MEWSGDEKRIQALFSELALQDHERAPRFENLWSRAPEPRAPQFRTRWAVVMAGALVVTACLLVAWSWSRSIASLPPQAAVNVPPQTISTPLAPSVYETPRVLSETPRSEPRRQKRLTRHQQVEPAVTAQATLLSQWQSPTQQFMQSPSGLSLPSLPQLNQSVEDLKLFLSMNNE